MEFEQFLIGLAEKGSWVNRNHYSAGLKQFGAWLRKQKRWSEDRFCDLKTMKAKRDPKRKKKGFFCDKQLDLLIDATERRGPENYLDMHPSATEEKLDSLRRKGKLRSRIYLFAANSGLRQDELRTLRWRDFNLNRFKPRVIVQPNKSKNGKEEPVNLPQWLAEQLKAWKAESSAKSSNLVFSVGTHILRTLMADMKFAGIPRVDDKERTLNFHSLRRTFAAKLFKAGNSIKYVQRQMRHATMAMTMDVYLELDLDDLEADAIELPEPNSKIEPSQAKAKGPACNGYATDSVANSESERTPADGTDKGRHSEVGAG